MSQFIRGHVIQLQPNNKQASHFAQASGVARLSYSWALADALTVVSHRRGSVVHLVNAAIHRKQTLFYMGC